MSQQNTILFLLGRSDDGLCTNRVRLRAKNFVTLASSARNFEVVEGLCPNRVRLRALLCDVSS